ncbi:MAG: hypothetical protein JO022_19910 [Acidobacteriaceae bacterium]|nr:hypothetical protein [Acidobacteriaceae bacterium]
MFIPVVRDQDGRTQAMLGLPGVWVVSPSSPEPEYRLAAAIEAALAHGRAFRPLNAITNGAQEAAKWVVAAGQKVASLSEHLGVGGLR